MVFGLYKGVFPSDDEALGYCRKALKMQGLRPLEAPEDGNTMPWKWTFYKSGKFTVCDKREDGNYASKEFVAKRALRLNNDMACSAQNLFK